MILLCVIGLLCSLIPFAVVADTLEDDLLGSVSEQYESNGDPGLVSGGNGDLGGASYGAYQFAGNMGVPLTFAKWCVSSGESKTIGNRLIAAYEKDGNTFDKNFKTEWKAIAAEDKSGFYRLQRLYVKEKYYQPAVTALKNNLKLDVEQYGIAFKNAVWSRTVQHGLGSYSASTGFMGIMKQVESSLPNGLFAATEKELITAIYQESGKVVSNGTNPMKAALAGSNAWIIEKYQLEGKYLKYYSGNSASVQAGVYLRLRVNEIADLLSMLATYGGYGGSNNYGTVLPALSATTLTLSPCDALRGWQADNGTTLSLKTTRKKQGTGALKLKATTSGVPAGATLSFSGPVNLSGFTQITAQIYLSKEQTKQTSNIQLTFLNSKTVVYNAQWSLAALPIGWYSATFAIPTAAATEQIDQIHFSFVDVSGTAFLIDHVQAKTDSPEKTMQFATVNADTLNCRSGASADCETLSQFADQTFLMIMGRSVNGWYYCSGQDVNGRTVAGWCSGEYLTRSAFVVHSGDVDANGKVGAEDALLILKSVVGKITLTTKQKSDADVTYDMVVNANDAQGVLKIVVNKE